MTPEDYMKIIVVLLVLILVALVALDVILYYMLDRIPELLELAESIDGNLSEIAKER